MPFIDIQSRKDLDAVKRLPNSPGELCYVEYKKLIEEWNKDSRWTTVHKLFAITFGLSEEDTAKVLAWQVFLHTKVYPYEDIKKQENGDI